MINIEHKTKAFIVVILALPMLLTACSNLPIIEKDQTSGVIQEEFTKEATPLTNELNDFNEIEALYLDDEENAYLEALIRSSLKEDQGIKKNHRDVEQMDLQLYQNEKRNYRDFK